MSSGQGVYNYLFDSLSKATRTEREVMILKKLVNIFEMRQLATIVARCPDFPHLFILLLPLLSYWNKQWGVAREFNRRLKKKLDQNNIEIPFPHLTLYMGQEKGQAPPLHLSMEGNQKKFGDA
jgi:small-conductance mechanosensitive channel